MRSGVLALLAALVVVVNAQLMLPASYLNAYDPGWEKIIAAGKSRVPIVLINPNSGPGPSATDSVVKAFVRVAQKCKAAGVKVLGYVDSSYTKIPLSKVKKQMDDYYSWFGGVDGYFIDQAAVDCKQVPYYQTIYDKCKSYNTNCSVLLNPGVMTNECYVNVSDILLTAEYDWKAYGANQEIPQWVFKYSPERFYHVAYGVPDVSVGSALSIARSRNAGYVYFTDQTLPNPYGKLPAYITTQIRELVVPLPQ